MNARIDKSKLKELDQTIKDSVSKESTDEPESSAEIAPSESEKVSLVTRAVQWSETEKGKKVIKIGKIVVKVLGILGIAGLAYGAGAAAAQTDDEIDDQTDGSFECSDDKPVYSYDLDDEDDSNDEDDGDKAGENSEEDS